jgi:hypothetical protein
MSAASRPAILGPNASGVTGKSMPMLEKTENTSLAMGAATFVLVMYGPSGKFAPTTPTYPNFRLTDCPTRVSENDKQLLKYDPHLRVMSNKHERDFMALIGYELLLQYKSLSICKRN